MGSRKGRWNTPECPLCVRWTCTKCGHVKANPVNRLSWRSYPAIKCNECGSTEGTSQPVHHIYASTHDRHVEIFRKKSSPVFQSPSELRELETLAIQLGLLIEEFRRTERAARRVIPGSPEHLFARNTGFERLQEIEAYVRRWALEHPERGTP